MKLTSIMIATLFSLPASAQAGKTPHGDPTLPHGQPTQQKKDQLGATSATCPPGFVKRQNSTDSSGTPATKEGTPTLGFGTSVADCVPAPPTATPVDPSVQSDDDPTELSH